MKAGHAVVGPHEGAISSVVSRFAMVASSSRHCRQHDADIAVE